MKTVGFPKRLSLETGPYFLSLSSDHASAILARIALRRPRLWPTKGSPSDPGGSSSDDLSFSPPEKEKEDWQKEQAKCEEDVRHGRLLVLQSR